MAMRIETRVIDGQERKVIVPKYGYSYYVKHTQVTKATINVPLSVGEEMIRHGQQSYPPYYRLLRKNEMSYTFTLVGTREEIEESVRNSKKYYRCRLVRWHDWQGERTDKVCITKEED